MDCLSNNVIPYITNFSGIMQVTSIFLEPTDHEISCTYTLESRIDDPLE